MKIYFSCSITGGRADQPVYAALVGHLEARGHTVPTAALAGVGILAEEAEIDPGVVYARDVAWVNAADALIAEVSTPSHGVGYEIALALGRGLPVLCLYRAGGRVSKMLLGNTEPGLRLGAYAGPAEALALVDAFLATAGG
ncbi:MAG: nucleoside 2-deoxyribosyltransferase [Anaerolineales bacterium]|nr:nucleoside 2-deoxyribosyltransferase [Anaerolineales bacterium]